MTPITLKRRQFLSRALAGSLGLSACPALRNAAFAQSKPTPFDVRALFRSNDPDVLRLTEDVFRQCVLAKIMQPEGTLKRRWLQSGTGDAPFYGQWIWDTMFVVDLLALL